MLRAIPHSKLHPEPFQKSGRGSINLLLYLGTVLGKLGPSCQPQENLLSRLGPGKWGASNFLGPNLPWRKSRISSPGKFGPGAQFATQGLDWTLKANHCCNVNGVFVRTAAEVSSWNFQHLCRCQDLPQPPNGFSHLSKLRPTDWLRMKIVQALERWKQMWVLALILPTHLLHQSTLLFKMIENDKLLRVWQRGQRSITRKKERKERSKLSAFGFQLIIYAKHWDRQYKFLECAIRQRGITILLFIQSNGQTLPEAQWTMKLVTRT